MLILALFPCLANGISVGRFVDLALARSLGAVKELEATCRFKLDDCAGTRRDFMAACSNALAASVACQVTDGCFSLHFVISADFNIRQWVAEVACPCATQHIWPACWVDTSEKSSSSSSKAGQDILDIYGEDLGVVPPNLILALGAARDR